MDNPVPIMQATPEMGMRIATLRERLLDVLADELTRPDGLSADVAVTATMQAAAVAVIWGTPAHETALRRSQFGQCASDIFLILVDNLSAPHGARLRLPVPSAHG